MKVVLFLFCLLAFQADAGYDQAYTVERLQGILNQAAVHFGSNPRMLQLQVGGAVINKENGRLKAEVYVCYKNNKPIYSQVSALLSGKIFLIKPCEK